MTRCLPKKRKTFATKCLVFKIAEQKHFDSKLHDMTLTLTDLSNKGVFEETVQKQDCDIAAE